MQDYHDLDIRDLEKTHKHYHFVVWLHEEGWEPYIYDAQYIHTSSKKVRNVKQLWSDYVATWPASVKDQI